MTEMFLSLKIFVLQRSENQGFPLSFVTSLVGEQTTLRTVTYLTQKYDQNLEDKDVNALYINQENI